jgi:exodeoxyribonuclease VII small subunit
MHFGSHENWRHRQDVSMNQDDLKTLTFEQAYSLLQETVQQLEAGNLPLEESIALYQKGMALAKQCGWQLDNAELSIKKVTPVGDLVDYDDT